MPKIGFASIGMIGAPWIDGLKAAVEHQFEAFELNCVYPDVDPERISTELIAEVKEIREESGIEICIHAPFFEMNIAAFCPSIRAESIRLVQKAADLGEKFGSRVMVVHNGCYSLPLRPGKDRKNDRLMKLQWDANIEALKEINDYALSKGLTVCLENLGFDPYSIDCSLEDMTEIRECVSESLCFTYDMGHARLMDGVQKGISLLGENIRHIHVTDNFGENDDHLPLGDGNFDCEGFVDFLRNFPHVITLELADEGSSPDPMLRARDAMNRLLWKTK